MNPIARSLAGAVALAAVATAAHAQDAPPPPPPPDEAGQAAPVNRGGTGSNRYLLLPDISFIGIFDGVFTNDRRAAGRDRLLFREGELAIQSFVYPGIKQEAFVIFGDGETSVEEAFLTVQHLKLFSLPVSATVGRRKVPFGRVNQLHPHSWSYIVPPAALSNLVADESLNGDGAYVSYLFPTRQFLQLDLGLFGAKTPAPSLTDGERPSGGAAFQDGFGTGRLWASTKLGKGDLELGVSRAQGKGVGYDIAETAFRPNTTLSGVDASLRLGANDAKRLLLRGEWIGHEQRGQGLSRRAEGYYVSADRRLSSLESVGLRYDSTANPFVDGHERTVSLIGTHQLTEQTYLRAQLTSGERFGVRHVNELRVQWVWGVGPHTHNLE